MLCHFATVSKEVEIGKEPELDPLDDFEGVVVGAFVEGKERLGSGAHDLKEGDEDAEGDL